jgi:hypothetical protein
MDGKGRFLDNIFIERLWRSLKYEEVYIKAYGSVAEGRQGIGGWLGFYNQGVYFIFPTNESHGARRTSPPARRCTVKRPDRGSDANLVAADYFAQVLGADPG